MHVKEIMTQPVLTVTEETSLEEVAHLLLERRIGCVPVVTASNQLVGIVTESDFSAKEKGIPFSTFRLPQVFGQWMPAGNIEKIYQAARRMTVREIMRTRVVTVTEDQTLEDVITLMVRHNINRVPVVRGGVPVGIVARHDLLRLMVTHLNR